MRTTHRAGIISVALFGATAMSGCALRPNDDVSEFREAIPRADDVEVPGPESTGSSTASLDGLQGTASHDDGEDEWWADGPWAKYYGFTRMVRRNVNEVTAAVLGSAWLIVHTQPSSVDDREAVWGPYTDALSPVTWRFRVTEVAPQEYEYVLEGRPKKSVADDDYRTVLSGSGYGRAHSLHGDGAFRIDLDAGAELDPFGTEGESGAVSVTHALSTWPELTVTAEVTPTETDAWWNVTSTRHEDGSGQLRVDAHDDVDDDGGTALEDVTIASQWKPTGAGRADITLSGGDLPLELVTAVECWDSDFYRSYYSDSVLHEPTEGSKDACAFASAEP